jgi:hypothetical protein
VRWQAIIDVSWGARWCDRSSHVGGVSTLLLRQPVQKPLVRTPGLQIQDGVVEMKSMQVRYWCFLDFASTLLTFIFRVTADVRAG